MAANKRYWKLAQLAKEFNVARDRIVNLLHKEGYTKYKGKPNEKIPQELVQKLARHFGQDKKFKDMLEEMRKKEELEAEEKKKTLSLEDVKQHSADEEVGLSEPEVIIKDVNTGQNIIIPKDAVENKTPEQETTVQEEQSQPQEQPQSQTQIAETKEQATEQKSTDIGLKVVGKIDLEEVERKAKPKKAKTAEKKPKPQPKQEPKSQLSPIEQEEKSVEQVLERVDQLMEQTEKLEKQKSEPEQSQQPQEQQAEQPLQTQVEQAQEQEQTQKPSVEDLLTKPNISQPKVLGKIDLPEEPRKSEKKSKKQRQKPKPHSEQKGKKYDKSKKDSRRSGDKSKYGKKQKGRRFERVDIEEEAKHIKNVSGRVRKPHIIDQSEVDQMYHKTMQQAAGQSKSMHKKIKQRKKEQQQLKALREEQMQEKERRTLRITEFITIGQLATLMGVDPIEVMNKALSLGIRANINFPLEGDDIILLADEFGYEVEFVDIITLEELETQYEDKEEDLVPRPPIVTVMGHVDHGKTSLLDYIRKTNVVAGEAGGITQHIGAYHITLDDGREITFIDTPGHEAFTAMRARGAKVTDIAVIVIAADDGVRPQTEEALDHAKAAGVPIIFAINKIDKETADPEKIRNQLAQRGYLVSSWGGEYFDVEISAKTGKNIDELLETILLVAEDLNLRANPNRPAVGTVLEASVQKGMGPVVNVLVRTGTLRKGDIILAGSTYGHVRKMFNERKKEIKEAGPAIPAQILGLKDAPEPGEPFIVMDDEKEARKKAQQRAQIKNIIAKRSHKTLTLEEISRRLQVGEFHEINVIIRADVQGTAEALAEKLESLSTDEVKVTVLRKAAGEITQSDVMLAKVSNAIIVGFQVRPSSNVRKIAEQNQVEIRTYSVIYDAIEEFKEAIKGMLKPKIKEEYLGSAKVLKIFKIKGVGTVAGCKVVNGRINKDAKIRVLRGGKVVYEGEIASLKHFQADVDEVVEPQECGMTIKNFNDIKKDDEIEAYKVIQMEVQL